MKKRTIYLLLLTVCLHTNAQDLFVIKKDFANPENYIHSLIQINETNGSTLDSYNFTTDFPVSENPENLTFDVSTNEVFAIADTIILKYNLKTQTETAISLERPKQGDYGDIIIANSKLFVTKRDYSTTPAKHYLIEISKSNGSTINTYTFLSTMPNGYSPESLTFDASRNEIFGIQDTLIIKYNIETETEKIISLQKGDQQDYGEIIIANSKLYVTKRDYSSTTYSHFLLELNKSNGNVVKTYTFANTFSDSYSPQSLTFDLVTNEILGLIDADGGTIIKYNIDNETQTELTLSTDSQMEYTGIISTKTNTVSVSNNLNNKNKGRVIKAFNAVGQEIPINTKNGFIILLYENGSCEKIYNAK